MEWDHFNGFVLLLLPGDSDVLVDRHSHTHIHSDTHILAL